MNLCLLMGVDGPDQFQVPKISEWKLIMATKSTDGRPGSHSGAGSELGVTCSRSKVKSLSKTSRKSKVLPASELKAKSDQQSSFSDGQSVRQLFFNEREVAIRYGLSVKTLQNWRVAGEGPKFSKVGRAVRYRLRHLRLWERSLTTGGGKSS